MKDAAVGVRKRSTIDRGYESIADAMHSRWQLHAETLAAFGTAAGQNQAAAASCHTRAKTVRAFAVDVAGLICTLHGRVQ